MLLGAQRGSRGIATSRCQQSTVRTMIGSSRPFPTKRASKSPSKWRNWVKPSPLTIFLAQAMRAPSLSKAEEIGWGCGGGCEFGHGLPSSAAARAHLRDLSGGGAAATAKQP